MALDVARQRRADGSVRVGVGCASLRTGKSRGASDHVVLCAEWCIGVRAGHGYGGVCVQRNSALGKPAAATRSISLGGQGICERHKKGTGDVQKKARHRIWVVPVQRSHPRGGGGVVWRARGR
jgi:hypothetical protein